MKTLSICSLSGGQGKTTTSLLLGRFLAQLGHSVCLIDADPQHSLTLFAKGEIEDDDPSLFEFLKGQGDPLDCVYPVEDYANLFIIPSDDTLDGAQNYLAQTGVGATVLNKRLSVFQQDFDYCIIDSPPQRSQLVLSVFGAADLLIIPAEATIKGFASAVRTLDLFEQQKDIGATQADLMGIMPFRDRWVGLNQTKESQLARDAMIDEVGETLVLPSILESEQYKRSVAHGHPLSDKHTYPFEQIHQRLLDLGA